MLRLIESTEKLAPLCRRLEGQIKLPPELGEVELPVALLPNFEDQPDAEKSSLVLHEWAAYRPSQGRIIVNESTFFDLPEASALATLTHEVGHAIYERAAGMGYDLGYRGLDEELLADVLACDWGLCEEVCEMRRASYGNDYCDLLRTRDPTPQFVAKMGTWLQQYNMKKTLAMLNWTW